LLASGGTLVALVVLAVVCLLLWMDAHSLVPLLFLSSSSLLPLLFFLPPSTHPPQSPDASKALALRSSSEGIQWAKDFQASAVADSPLKRNTTATTSSPPSNTTGVSSSVGQKLERASADKKGNQQGNKKNRAPPSALMQVAANLNAGGLDGTSSFDSMDSSGSNSGNSGGNRGGRSSKSKKKKKKHGKKKTIGGGLDSAVLGVSSEKSALLGFAAEHAEQGNYSTTSRKSHEEVHPSAWTVDQVCDWLASHGIPEKIRDKFSEQVIDGFMLLNTEEDDVVNDLRITRRAEVNKLLAAIQLLKARAKRTVDDDEEEEDEEDEEDDSSDFEHSSEEEDEEDNGKMVSRWGAN
jgi:hypothetical protein